MSARQLPDRWAEYSPFHARRLAGLDLSRFEPGDLARLPVMTKAQMMAVFDDVVTDRRLSRRLADQHLAASVNTAGLLLDEYVCLASGESSGPRGVFVQTLSEYTDFSPRSCAGDTRGRPRAGRRRKACSWPS